MQRKNKKYKLERKFIVEPESKGEQDGEAVKKKKRTLLDKRKAKERKIGREKNKQKQEWKKKQCQK